MELKLVDKNGNALSVTKGRALQTFRRLPDRATLVNEGKVWQVLDQTTTAAIVTLPDVTAGLTVQNPSGSGKYYVVLSIMAYMDVVPATLSTVSVFQCAHKLATTAYTRDITIQATGAGAICGLKAGQGSYAGSIILDRGATVINDGWTPTPLQIVGNIATTDFNGKEAELITPVIIAPSFHWSLQCLSTVTTNQVALGLSWAELDEDDLVELA